jgi:hypothetical protein
MDAKIKPRKARLNGGNCVRSESAASMIPGMMAPDSRPRPPAPSRRAMVRKAILE